MKVDALVGISADAGVRDLSPVQRTRFDEFARWLEGEVRVLDTQLQGAETSLRGLAVGETRSVHDVMIALEQARLSFELAVQVRNKALEAYQEIMRMQV